MQINIVQKFLIKYGVKNLKKLPFDSVLFCNPRLFKFDLLKIFAKYKMRYHLRTFQRNKKNKRCSADELAIKKHQESHTHTHNIYLNVLRYKMDF